MMVLTTVQPTKVVGVLLAGGKARRMGGGDKSLRPLAGRSILAHVIERMRPQVEALVLNANGDPRRFDRFGLPVIGDVIDGQAGPLAGVLTGMEWTQKHQPHCEWVVSIATDTPFLPKDLVERLAGAIRDDEAELASVITAGRTHPVIGLWPVRLAVDLRRAMVDEDIRKIDRFTARYRLANVVFPAEPIDPFFNTNRPEDLEEAERLLADGTSETV